MQEWHKQILSSLAEKLGYSEFYVSRKFKEISGMSLRVYVGQHYMMMLCQILIVFSVPKLRKLYLLTKEYSCDRIRSIT